MTFERSSTVRLTGPFLATEETMKPTSSPTCGTQELNGGPKPESRPIVRVPWPALHEGGRRWVLWLARPYHWRPMRAKYHWFAYTPKLGSLPPNGHGESGQPGSV